MSVSLFYRTQVKDFDSWLNPDQDEVNNFMRSQGVMSFGLVRGFEDRNRLMVHFQFPDIETAEAFKKTYEAARAQMEDNNVVPGTSEWWLGEDFRPFSPA